MVHLEQEPSLGSTSSSGSSNMSSSDVEPPDRGSAKAMSMQNPAISRQKSRESDNPASPTAQETSKDAVVSPTAGGNNAASSGSAHPPKKQLQHRHSLPTFVGSNRGRIVSLDRGHAEVTIPAQGTADDDDDSTVTSDGESSYFAKHLPSPKSGTRFSFNDNASASSAPVALYGTHSQKLESDASLSFSDDDDEDDLHASGQPPQSFGDNMYSSPNGITRVHSVSSLVSSPPPPTTSSPHPEPSWPGNVEDQEATAGVAQQQRSHSSPPNTYGATAPPVANMPPVQRQQVVGERRRSADPWLMPHQQQQQWLTMMHNSFPSDNRSRGGSKESLPLVYSEDDSTTLGSDGMEYTLAGRSANRGPHPGQHNHTNSLGASSSLESTDGSLRAGVGGGNGVKKENRLESGTSSTVATADKSDKENKGNGKTGSAPRQYKVYCQRWIMLLYMSVLNLLSDWTCYSVAPIATLTQQAFGAIDPEQLVVVFLGANAVATACEPIILSRLGLRRTVVFGALLLMTGSVIKSGGLPPIIESSLNKGEGEWHVYLGFFLVGLSQPLYQCTPALLSASWFPERERTMATGVALNANQLGIGFAFVFGTLLVATSDDIVPYFGLLSIISTLTFVGALIQFDDAPPTPPSETARVMRGDLEWRLPDAASNIWQSVRNLGASSRSINGSRSEEISKKENSRRSKAESANEATAAGSRANPSASTTRRRQPTPTPSNASTHRPVRTEMKLLEAAMTNEDVLLAPSPMMPGVVGGGDCERPVTSSADNSGGAAGDGTNAEDEMLLQPHAYPPYHAAPPYPHHPPPPGPGGAYPPPPYYPPYHPPPPHYYDPTRSSQSQVQQLSQQQHQLYPSLPPPQQAPPQQGYYGGPAAYHYHPYYYGYPPTAPTPQALYGGSMYGYDSVPYPAMGVAQTPSFDEGAEPTLTQTDHHLDINIRDDQIILSTRACFSRPGFIHALVSFTVSGIVINTLSTFMDYLVRLNGAGREYVGIVGGSFQFAIMISSLIIGKQTDRTRAYYSVTIGMLVLGAFGLAECGVSLDGNRGGDLRWSLIVVAILVGPLQPVSTELGVEVAYPLSENTVLVIQQLFSNLLSALFIPFFKALRDVGTEKVVGDDGIELYERPQYTFSFYLLIVLHAAVTIFFATFNGRYLRYEHELAKKEKEEREHSGSDIEDDEVVDGGGFYAANGATRYEEHPQMATMYPNERQPLMAASGSHNHGPVI